MRSLMVAGLVFATIGCRGKRPVVMDHDGAIDDYVALIMLLNSPDRRLRAVTVSFGNSYREAAAETTQRILASYRIRVPVGLFQGSQRGKNEFPAEWRRTAAALNRLPAFEKRTSEASNDAQAVLWRALAARKVEVLATGPLTNLALALRSHENLIRHIRRLVVMGGAVRFAGNGPGGAAEYNIFIDPEAANYVFSLANKGLPIELIPLDATNSLPVTKQFVDRLLASSKPPAQQAGQILSLAGTEALADSHYFLWDGAAALALLHPELFSFVPLRLKVTPDGRTVESPDGYGPIQVALGIRSGVHPMEEVVAILER